VIINIQSETDGTTVLDEAERKLSTEYHCCCFMLFLQSAQASQNR
jgi:hypothetical protein